MSRPPAAGEFYGPHFTKQDMSYNEPIKQDIYNFMSYDNLEFWADKPDKVFEINVDLEIPLKPEDSVPGLAIIGGKITLPVRGYFFTEYMIEGGTSGFDNTTRIENSEVQ